MVDHHRFSKENNLTREKNDTRPSLSGLFSGKFTNNLILTINTQSAMGVPYFVILETENRT